MVEGPAVGKASFFSVLLFFLFIFILWKAWVCVDGADSGQQLFLSLYTLPPTHLIQHTQVKVLKWKCESERESVKVLTLKF